MHTRTRCRRRHAWIQGGQFFSFSSSCAWLSVIPPIRCLPSSLFLRVFLLSSYRATRARVLCVADFLVFKVTDTCFSAWKLNIFSMARYHKVYSTFCWIHRFWTIIQNYLRNGEIYSIKRLNIPSQNSKAYVEFYKKIPLTVVQKSQKFKLEAHLRQLFFLIYRY